VDLATRKATLKLVERLGGIKKWQENSDEIPCPVVRVAVRYLNEQSIAQHSVTALENAEP